jgi:hypothetical protein
MWRVPGVDITRARLKPLGFRSAVRNIMGLRKRFLNLESIPMVRQSNSRFRLVEEFMHNTNLSIRCRLLWACRCQVKERKNERSSRENDCFSRCESATGIGNTIHR